MTIFRDLARPDYHFSSFLQQRFGINSINEGNDLILSKKQIQSIIGHDVLKIRPILTLADYTCSQLSTLMYKQIPDDFKEHQPTSINRINISKDYGIISEYDEASARLAVATEGEVAKILQANVLPLMSKLGASTVTAVTLDASRLQLWLSLNKMMMLASKYAPRELGRLVERGAFHGILPTTLDIPVFIDAMTRLSPFHMTLVSRRMGCTWHFQNGEGIWCFPVAPSNGIVGETIGSLNPLAHEGHSPVLAGLGGMDPHNIWRFLRFVVTGINRLMRFASDPAEFEAPDGSADLLKNMQVYGAIHLLFADILGLNFSTSSHNRISYAFSALDKIANLRCQLFFNDYLEPRAMSDLLSKSQASELTRLLRFHLSAMNYDELADGLIYLINDTYEEIHDELANHNAVTSKSESARLEVVRAQRNLRHGTFLLRQQFENLFFEAPGIIPSEIATIPFLLMLGLICDAREFLSFKPTVTT